MKKETKIGTYSKSQKGFGFVKPEDCEEEIYISKENSQNALNGDLVIIEITAEKTADKKAEGRIIKIIKVVVTVVLIVVLFFISYLIIRIILKSRNIYYTTLRMLGATYKNVKRILDIELFTNASISYSVLMLFIYFVRSNVIKLEYIYKLTNYIGIKEYVFMYIVLIVISRLISSKFARKLFKNTAINTYNEEV